MKYKLIIILCLVLMSCNQEVYKINRNKHCGLIMMKKDNVRVKIKMKEKSEDSRIYHFSIKNLNLSPIYVDTNVIVNEWNPIISSSKHRIISFGVSMSNLLEDIGTTLIEIKYLQSYTREFIIKGENIPVGFYFFYLLKSNVLTKSIMARNRKYIKVPRNIVYESKEVYLGWFNPDENDYNNQTMFIYDKKLNK